MVLIDASDFLKIEVYIMDEHGIYPLVIQHSHGKSIINGSLTGKITCKWATFHSYVK